MIHAHGKGPGFGWMHEVVAMSSWAALPVLNGENVLWKMEIWVEMLWDPFNSERS